MCAVPVSCNVFAEPFSDISADRAVSFERIFINAYFPAATAGIAAFIGNAFEARVIIGVTKPVFIVLHSLKSFAGLAVKHEREDNADYLRGVDGKRESERKLENDEV